MEYSLDHLIETRNKLCLTGAGVHIGHLDSGVTQSHPGLKDRIASFAYYDRLGEVVCSSDTVDESGHGTQTAGITAGIAPGATFASAAVIESGYVVLRILRGMEWLLGQNVKIALLPVGIRETTPVFWHAVAAMRSRGILPIVAVGNGGAGRAYSPGWYPHVLSVGAQDANGCIAGFSGSHNVLDQCLKPDVVAAGVDVKTLDVTGSAVRQAGTSMSAAVVAAIAALLYEAVPSATPEMVEQSITMSSCRPANDQSHRVRCGGVDLKGALEYLNNSSHTKVSVHSDRLPIPEYLDARLEQQLQYGDPAEPLPVIVVGADDPVHISVERISRAIGEQPTRRIDLPHANAVFLLSSRRFIKQLIADPGVAVATPPDTDIFA